MVTTFLQIPTTFQAWLHMGSIGMGHATLNVWTKPFLMPNIWVYITRGPSITIIHSKRKRQHGSFACVKYYHRHIEIFEECPHVLSFSLYLSPLPTSWTNKGMNLHKHISRFLISKVWLQSSRIKPLFTAVVWQQYVKNHTVGHFFLLTRKSVTAIHTQQRHKEVRRHWQLHISLSPCLHHRSIINESFFF